jgi:V8-like Glu-specific endopeptidase
MELRITKTGVWPNSAHGHLVISVGGEVRRASGVLVGPRHVLTAAHNLDGGGGKVSLRFNPGQDGKWLPFGGPPVVDAAIPQAWRQSRDPAWDLAVLRLGTSPGEKAGFYGVAAPPGGELHGQQIAIMGYPIKFPAEMWRRLGRVLDDGWDLLRYTNKTAKGDSGGAVYLHDADGGLTVVGVHRYLGDGGSEGVRLRPEKLDFVRKHLI